MDSSSNSKQNLEDGLIDTIGSLGAELEKYQRGLETELKFVSALEQKLSQARARATSASAQADLLEEAVRKADIELSRLERATELAVRSTEMAKQHAGQMTERLRVHQETSKGEQERLAERVTRLEALARRMNVPEPEGGAAATSAVGGASGKPEMREFIRAAVIQRSLH
uniref:M protein n=3 Tax=Macrostomum lignano TaxID=282301 RepID=A0A1I8HKY1_9PLAT